MKKEPNGILKLCGCCGEGENCVACSELNYNNRWIYMDVPVKIYCVGNGVVVVIVGVDGDLWLL